MKKGLLLLTSLLFLAGCALPLPLKVASWALDGISYLATNKSIAENGLSIIAGKDCSLMRPLKGQPVCIGNNYDIAKVLKNAVAPVAVNDRDVQSLAMAEFEVAAGPAPDKLSSDKLSYDASEFSDAWRFIRQQAGREERAEPKHIAKTLSRAPIKVVKAVTSPTLATGPPGYDAGESTGAWAFIVARNDASDDTVSGAMAGAEPQAEPQAEPPEKAQRQAQSIPAPTPMPRASATGPDIRPSAGLYYVIGSLTRLADVARLSRRRIDLESRVVVAQLRDRPIYREVVGPFKRSEKQAVRRMIEKSGVTKAWLTFIDPRLWTLADPAEISTLIQVGAQTASLR